MSLRDFKFHSRDSKKQKKDEDGSDSEDWAKILNLSPEKEDDADAEEDVDAKEDDADAEEDPPETQDIFEDTNAEVSEPETDDPKPGDPTVIVHMKPGTLGEWKLASLKHTLKAFRPDRFDRYKAEEMSYSERTRPYTIIADVYHSDGINVSEFVMENVYVFGRCRDGNNFMIHC